MVETNPIMSTTINLNQKIEELIRYKEFLPEMADSDHIVVGEFIKRTDEAKLSQTEISHACSLPISKVKEAIQQMYYELNNSFYEQAAVNAKEGSIKLVLIRVDKIKKPDNTSLLIEITLPEIPEEDIHIMFLDPRATDLSFSNEQTNPPIIDSSHL